MLDRVHMMCTTRRHAGEDAGLGAEVAAVKDRLCFYAERSDLTVDGVEVPRPDTLWRSRKSAELA